MATRFDLPEYLEEEDDEMGAYDESPSFPYPVVHGQPEHVDMKKLKFHFSLVKLNLHTSRSTTELKLLRHKARNKRKVLLKLP